MNRHVLGWIVVLIFAIGSVVLAAPEVYEQLWAEDIETRVEALEAEVFGTTSTTTAESTTTTTEATTELVIPETLAYPKDQLVGDGEGFLFQIYCAHTPSVECPDPTDNDGDQFLDDFVYAGHGMPYLYSEAVDGNHDHAWWVAGDREAYHCAYAFMYDKHPNPFGEFDEPRDAEFIARATIVAPPEVAYGTIIDRYMAENIRYYDGSPWASGNWRDQDCRAEALDDFDYDGYQSHGPDDIRVDLFRADGEIGDIRDFDAASTAGWYEFLSIEERSFLDREGNPYTVTRVALVHVLEGQGVSHVFYYDTLGSGRIAVEVNGSLVR